MLSVLAKSVTTSIVSLLLYALLLQWITNWSTVSTLEVNRVKLLSVNTDYIETFNISVVTKDQRNKLNATFALSRDVKNFNFRIIIKLLRPNQQWAQLMSTDLDGCKFLNGQYDVRIVKDIYKELMKSKTWQRKCPLRAHDIWKLEYFDLQEKMFPDYIPNMTYYVNFMCFRERIKLYDIEFEGSTKDLCHDKCNA